MRRPVAVSRSLGGQIAQEIDGGRTSKMLKAPLVIPTHLSSPCITSLRDKRTIG